MADLSSFVAIQEKSVAHKMKTSSNNDRQYMLVPLITIGILIAASLLIVTPVLVRNWKPAIVAVRIDDIQDFYCHDAQLTLLDYCLNNSVPVTLSIIPRLFGRDKELVDTVKSAMRLDFEVAIHGWEHEDLAHLSLEDQKTRIQQGKTRLNDVLGLNASILVPPMFSYNNDTLAAMHANNLEIVSGLSDLQQQGQVSEGILSIPATIELSDFANDTWKMKSVESVMKEVNASNHLHGYAVLVTHPQEFIKDAELSQEALSTYSTLIQSMEARYSFTTLGGLRDKVLQSFASRTLEMTSLARFELAPSRTFEKKQRVRIQTWPE
jgi:predicted deacetylase